MNDKTDNKKHEVEIDINRTDFFVWDYNKLCGYRDSLISVIASLRAQLDRHVIEVENACEYDDGKLIEFDPHWHKKVSYSRYRAELIYDEVIRRISVMERHDFDVKALPKAA